MKVGELIDRVTGWYNRLAPVTAPIAAVVLALVLTRACNRAVRAEAEAKRLQEAAELARKGVPVSEQVPDVRPRVAELERDNAELRDALAKARAAAPGAHPVGATSASTAPAPVGGTPRDAASPPSSSPSSGSAAVAPPPACVLALGDLLRLRMTDVDLQTKAGNHVIVGTQEAWRMSPGEPTLLLRQPWTEIRASLKAASADEEPGWGAGATAGVTGSGWLAGATVLTPEERIPIIGRRGGIAVSGAGGPGGFVGLATVYLR